MQLEAPVTDTKVPAAHAVHVAAAAEVEPIGPKLPAVQGVPEHTLAPGAVEKVPAAHWVQLEEPAGEKEPAKQLTHVAADVAPVADEDLPATHAEQLEAPEADHEPAGHRKHDDAPAAEDEPAAQLLQVE